MKKWKALSLTVVLGILLTGCGANGGSMALTEAAYDNAAPAMAAESKYEAGGLGEFDYEMATEEDVSYDGGEGGAESPQVADTSRKLIKNVNLEVETESFDELLAAVGNKTESLSGYIEESYTYNGSQYYGRGTRNASLTIRIPADKLNEFLSDISDISNVISRNESVTDVTLRYVDMESHKKALTAEQDRLLELLGQAENIEDIITIESRLSEVRYQIESMESQLRTMDNQVSYSTVYLSIDEVKQYTPVAEQSIGEKIATGFRRSLSNVGNGFVNFGISLVINLPYIVVWAVIILICLLVIRVLIKKGRAKKLKKQMMQMQGIQADAKTEDRTVKDGENGESKKNE